MDRLFVIDGLISVPVAVASFFLLPDLPGNTRSRYLTQEVSHFMMVVSRLT